MLAWRTTQSRTKNPSCGIALTGRIGKLYGEVRLSLMWWAFCIQNYMSKIKIIIISSAFYILGGLITLGMFKLWFWVFTSKLILTVLLLITLIASGKYFWDHTEWTISKWNSKDPHE